MITKRILIAAGAAVALGTLIGPVVIHAQDEDSDSIHDQLRIMTQILEASIGKDAIDRRVQMSVFDSRIRTEYIPTVGAIFTIPINFPLHPSEDEKDNGQEEGVEKDLWEFYLSGMANSTSRIRVNAMPPIPPVPPIEPLDTLNIEIDIEGVDEQGVHNYEDVARKLLEEGRRELLYIPVNERARDNYLLYVMGGKSYDPVKVSTLTRSIVETIAQYGHRLSSLQNSERVLVVLEAPRPRGSTTIHISHDDQNMKVAPEPAPAPSPGEKVRTEIHIEGLIGQPEGLKWERRGQQRGLLGSILRQSVQEGNNYSFWMSPISRKAARDHRLLAFKKSDLQQERSYDSIKGKVETTDY